MGRYIKSDFDVNKDSQLGFEGFIDKKDLAGVLVLEKVAPEHTVPLDAEDWRYGTWSEDYPDFYLDGGRQFYSYYGDKDIADYIDWEYADDDEICEELSNATGKDYESHELRGVVQREYATLYTPVGVSRDEINWIESQFFNSGDEYITEDGESIYVPSDYNWSEEKTLEWISKWYGYDKDSIVIVDDFDE